MLDKWDRRFVELARHFAEWSKDPVCKVGSVIVDSNRIVRSHGYNGFPRGVRDDMARYSEKMVKHKFVVHAEANAILNAKDLSGSLTLYATKFPCTECVKMILQVGIDRVVAPHQPVIIGHYDGEDSVFARTMFEEASVELEEFSA